ncbi:hypothetical protein MHYP_G00126830 [Metynnis hypsauchen]
MPRVCASIWDPTLQTAVAQLPPGRKTGGQEEAESGRSVPAEAKRETPGGGLYSRFCEGISSSVDTGKFLSQGEESSRKLRVKH